MKQANFGRRFKVSAWLSVLLLLATLGSAHAQEVQRDPAPCAIPPSGFTGECEPNLKLAGTNELQGKICQASIQDRIEWNYEGNSHWARSNLEKICRHAKYSLQPGVCFQRVMHGKLSYGSGTRWGWQAALKLCASTLNATVTIACFNKAIGEQIKWPQAIEQCRTKP